MKVLISNDDGIQSPGLRALYKALVKAGHEVTAVAPLEQQSGKSHSITVFHPLRAQEYEDDGIKGTGVFGTPADCVKIGLGKLCGTKPDLVVTGINDGQNVGPDILYSGTVGAAAQGAHSGVPSIALSHAGRADDEEMEKAAEHFAGLLEKLDPRSLPRGRVININYPEGRLEDAKGMRVCRQSPAVFDNGYNERLDPRGGRYWWMDGGIEGDEPGENDRALLRDSWITVTPLRFDSTDYDSLKSLEGLFGGKSC